MTKKTLLSLCAFAFICSVAWVVSDHLPGVLAVLVIASPLALGALSYYWGL